MNGIKGFTLVEVMVTLVVFAIIFAAIFGILTFGRVAWETADRRIRLQQETRKAMDLITKELRQTSLGGIQFNESFPSEIKFTIPQTAPNAIEYILDSPGDLNGDGVSNQILRRVDTEPYSVLANNIVDLDFAVGNYIWIIIKAQTTTLQGRLLEMNLRSAVRWRN